VSAMMPERKYHVTIHAPGIGRVPLRVPRTEAEIARLRERYEVLETTPATPDAWGEALTAIVRLYQSARSRGDVVLAERAERALGELFGNQKFLEAERDPFPDAAPPTQPVRYTLRGIGRGKR
jgi:hypothetical protein